jgi:hypothetical protein
MGSFSYSGDVGRLWRNPHLLRSTHTEGLSHREIVRCLNRYLAQRLYPILLKDPSALT